MATLKQIDANRRNAQQSPGPRTVSGKQASSANALKSGIYAESEVLFTERRENLEALTAEYHARYRPTTPEARDLADSLIRSSWLLRRFAAAEAAIFNSNHTGDYPPATRFSSRLQNCAAALDGLQRRINSTERNYHRTLKALQALDPTPEPIDAQASSDNLASFPRSSPPTEPDPAAAPPAPVDITRADAYIPVPSTSVS